MEILNQARNLTLLSKNATVYGVHFASPDYVLFTGSSYSSSDPNNQIFTLSSPDTVLTLSLTGGGSEVVFKRLSGETTQDGTITVSSPGISKTKTVTIYKTGLVKSD